MRRPFLSLVVFAAGLLLMWPGEVTAQVPAAPPPEAPEISAGWFALASGQVGEAARVAATAVSRHPRSVAAITLLVHVELVRAGAQGGLVAYESWLAGRPLESPYLVRQIALAFLTETVRTQAGSEAGRRALRALDASGETPTLDALQSAMAARPSVDLATRAALGNEAAVGELVTALDDTLGDKTRTIVALRDAGGEAAVRAIQQVLSDPLPSNRMAAADALGTMGATSSIDALREVLRDEQFAPRFAAARALFRLGDMTGLPLIQELQVSEHATLRAEALDAMSTDPHAGWQSAVRQLLSDADPLVRLRAARLIAPYDPAAAESTVQGLLADDNLAIRQAAGQAYAESIVTDFAVLRQYLHDPDPLVRVTGATRVLELTR